MLVRRTGGQIKITVSLAPRIYEGAQAEAQKQRRGLEEWIAVAAKEALNDPNPLSGGQLGRKYR